MLLFRLESDTILFSKYKHKAFYCTNNKCLSIESSVPTTIFLLAKLLAIRLHLLLLAVMLVRTSSSSSSCSAIRSSSNIIGPAVFVHKHSFDYFTTRKLRMNNSNHVVVSLRRSVSFVLRQRQHNKSSLSLLLPSKNVTQNILQRAQCNFSSFHGSRGGCSSSSQSHQRMPLSLLLRGGGGTICNSSNATCYDAMTMTPSMQQQLQHNSKRFINRSSSDYDEQKEQWFRVFLGFGSNLGNRYQYIHAALQLLLQRCNNSNNTSSKLVTTSFLYETEPMYSPTVDDDNTITTTFMNGVVEIQTTIPPQELLVIIKSIEQQLGRNVDTSSSKYIRNGPRCVDIDILLYYLIINNNDDDDEKTEELLVVNESNLTIPHADMHNREFVLRPLADIVANKTLCLRNDDININNTNSTVNELLNSITNNGATSSARRVFPLPNDRYLRFHTYSATHTTNNQQQCPLRTSETLIMGILNVTPDSFCDGDRYNRSVETAVQHVEEMIRAGVHIIDIGGESTRPDATPVPMDEEIRRVVPVITAVRRHSSSTVSSIPISIDTRHAVVAKAAIDAGADIVNDVSGGMYDPDMFRTVSELGVGMILMHMRGTPQTMQSADNLQYSNVVQDVSTALLKQCDIASSSSHNNTIYRWMQIIDPGVGFAKNMNQNLELLSNLHTLRQTTGYVPILLGPSRKRFIHDVMNNCDDNASTSTVQPTQRDPGTNAAIVTAITLEQQAQQSNYDNNCCTIVRVHNVEHAYQSTRIMNAILQQQKTTAQDK